MSVLSVAAAALPVPSLLEENAPVPEHVVEVLHRGRLADSSQCEPLLGWSPEMSTREVVDSLFSWEGVVRTPARRAWEVAS